MKRKIKGVSKISNLLGSFSRWKESAEINRGLAHSLISNNLFKEYIQSARKRLGVETSGYEQGFDKAFFIWLDIESHGFDGEPDFHFLRFNEKGTIMNQNKNQKAIGEESLNILGIYNLPANFLYWIIDWVLFNETPPWMPYFNYVPIEDVGLQVAHSLALTTQEKRALKRDIKWINKELEKNSSKPINHKKSAEFINRAKNSRRKLRNIEMDLEIANEMSKRKLKKEKIIKESLYVNALRSKGDSDEKIVRMSKASKKNYGRGFVSFESKPKYTSKDIEAKFTKEKLKKGKGDFTRKRLERLKKYANKKL